MAASLHVARYTPRATGRMLRRWRRHRRQFLATPGLVAARLHLTFHFESQFGGVPTPWRWALLCGWEDADPRDEFLVDRGGPAPFLADAEESWQVSLEPVRLTLGEGWHGYQPSTHEVKPFERDEPALVMTHAKLLRARYMAPFQLENRRVVREMLAGSEPVWHIGAADHPMTRATFTIWPSKADMVRFAYRPDARHNAAQKHALAVPWLRESFFVRFRPTASSGTIDGRDPLAGLRPG